MPTAFFASTARTLDPSALSALIRAVERERLSYPPWADERYFAERDVRVLWAEWRRRGLGAEEWLAVTDAARAELAARRRPPTPPTKEMP